MKMISKHPVKVMKSDNQEAEKRIMLTCNKENVLPEHFDIESVVSCDDALLAKGNEFMYSESTSTKVIKTPKVFLQLSN